MGGGCQYFPGQNCGELLIFTVKKRPFKIDSLKYKVLA